MGNVDRHLLERDRRFLQARFSRRRRKQWGLLPFLAFLSLTCLDVQIRGDTPPGEPEVSSIFPQTGQRGTTLGAEIRGENLEGAYAVWWETGGLRARIKSVEEIAPEKKEGTPQEQTQAAEKHPGHLVSLQLEMDAHASIDHHRLRIITPAGVSNALDFFVTEEPSLVEGEASHDRPHQAQMVRFPVLVNGRIEKGGGKSTTMLLRPGRDRS